MARAQQKNRLSMGVGMHGLLGVLVLAGDVWAILNISQSAFSDKKKLVWMLAVILLPVLGLIVWYFLGPRSRGP